MLVRVRLCVCICLSKCVFIIIIFVPPCVFCRAESARVLLQQKAFSLSLGWNLSKSIKKCGFDKLLLQPISDNSVLINIVIVTTSSRTIPICFCLFWWHHHLIFCFTQIERLLLHREKIQFSVDSIFRSHTNCLLECSTLHRLRQTDVSSFLVQSFFCTSGNEAEMWILRYFKNKLYSKIEPNKIPNQICLFRSAISSHPIIVHSVCFDCFVVRCLPKSNHSLDILIRFYLQNKIESFVTFSILGIHQKKTKKKLKVFRICHCRCRMKRSWKLK